MRPLLLAISLTAWAAQPTTIEQRFAQLKKNPGELYQFLLRMPKGGDLHNHLSGAVYAESYIDAAAEDGLCADMKALRIAACAEGLPSAKQVASNNDLRNALINGLSMRGFVPGPETAHDHFFATFAKFGPIKEDHRGAFLAEVVRRAADQNESYLEIMSMNGR